MLTIAPAPAASRHGRATRADRTEEGEIEHVLPLGVTDFQESRPRTGCAEIVYQYVDLAVTTYGGLDERARSLRGT
jgi:hypothetical protein